MTFRVGKSPVTPPPAPPKPPIKSVLTPPRPSPQSQAQDAFEPPRPPRPSVSLEAFGNGRRNEGLGARQPLHADALPRPLDTGRPRRTEGVQGEVPGQPAPEWKTVPKDIGFYSIGGSRKLNATHNEPVQVLRTLGEGEDKLLDENQFEATWVEVRRQDGITAFVAAHSIAPMLADDSVAKLAPPELGAPLGPMLPAEGGGYVQPFEHGSISIDPAGNKAVTGADGGVLAEVPASTVSSLEDADAHHVTQRAKEGPNGEIIGNDYNDYDDKGLWAGYDDCGPTSVIIAASLVGVAERPAAGDAQVRIDEVRDLAWSEDTDTSRLSGSTRLAETLQKLGAGAVEHHPSSMDAIDLALERGNPVLAAGRPFNAGSWGKTTEGYLEYGTRNFDHWVVVVGRTPDGYIINDPLSANGPIVVTRTQLENYLTPTEGMIEVSPPLPQSGS